MSDGMAKFTGSAAGDGVADDDFAAYHAAAGVVIEFEGQYIGGRRFVQELFVQSGHLLCGDDGDG